MLQYISTNQESPYKLRAWRWAWVEQATNKTLLTVMDAEEEFTFRP